MTAPRRSILDQPNEVRFFLFLAAFGLVIGVIYALVSREIAGTILLLGFVLATGVVGVRLALGAGTAGGPAVDRPFLDETGRLPGESLAPFAVGLGAALLATATVFGAAMLLVGSLPFLWGAWTWLRGANAELSATQSAEPPEAPPPPAAPEPTAVQDAGPP